MVGVGTWHKMLLWDDNGDLSLELQQQFLKKISLKERHSVPWLGLWVRAWDRDVQVLSKPAMCSRSSLLMIEKLVDVKIYEYAQGAIAMCSRSCLIIIKKLFDVKKYNELKMLLVLQNHEEDVIRRLCWQLQLSRLRLTLQPTWPFKLLLLWQQQLYCRWTSSSSAALSS